MRKKLVKICLFATLTCGVPMYFDVHVEAANKYDKMVIADVENSLNVREKASTDSKVVGQMKRGNAGTIVKKGKQWTKIKSGKVVGYVSNDYVLTGKAMEQFAKQNVKRKDAVVTTEVLNVREKKSTKAKVLGKATKGDTFEVAEQAKKWTKIKYNKKNGYLSNDYIDINYRFDTATPLETSDSDVTISDNNTDAVGSNEPDNSTTDTTEQNGQSSNTDISSGSTEQEIDDDNNNNFIDVDAEELRREIVDYALQFVGNPYVYGGTSLTEGADCSGFIQSVYSKFGIKLNRVSADQALNGREVSLDEIQPGDLIFYVSRGSSRISHVSLYIGNNQVVHALNQSKGICVSNMYYNTPYTVRNVID